MQKKLGLTSWKTSVEAQKIDDSLLVTYSTGLTMF